MKWRLVIDPDREEEVLATVHRETAFTDALKSMVLRGPRGDRLAAFSEDGMKLLSFDEVECITLIGGKTYAVDGQGEKYEIRQRLYEAEALLPHNFIRISKSALANLDRLDRFAVSFNGSVDAVFRSGYKDLVSRRCFGEIKRRFGIK